MRIWVSTAVTTAVAFGVISTRANEVYDEVELRFVAPEICPKKDEFLAALTRMLGNRVTTPHTLVATVVITQASSAAFRLNLTTEFDGVSGQRILEGRTCRVVADAAAVTLALLLDPTLDLAAVRNSSEDRSAPEPMPAPGMVTKPEPAVATTKKASGREISGSVKAPRADWTAVLSSQIGAQLGVLPKVSPQVSLGLALGLNRGFIGATASYALPQDERIAPPNVGGRLWAASLGVQGCWLWVTHSPRFGTCVGADATRVQGHGTGVPSARTGATTWVAPSLSTYADFQLVRRTWFRVSAAGLVPLARPDTHLDELGTVQRPAKVVGRLAAGVVFDF